MTTQCNNEDAPHDWECRCPECLHADAAAADAHEAYVTGIEHGA